MFIAALLAIAKGWEQPNVHQRMDGKTSYPLSMGRGVIREWKGALTWCTGWVNPETLLSEEASHRGRLTQNLQTQRIDQPTDPERNSVTSYWGLGWVWKRRDRCVKTKGYRFLFAVMKTFWHSLWWALRKSVLYAMTHSLEHSEQLNWIVLNSISRNLSCCCCFYSSRIGFGPKVFSSLKKTSVFLSKQNLFVSLV